MYYAFGSDFARKLDRLRCVQKSFPLLSLRFCPHTSLLQPFSLLQQLNRYAAAAQTAHLCLLLQRRCCPAASLLSLPSYSCLSLAC